MNEVSTRERKISVHHLFARIWILVHLLLESTEKNDGDIRLVALTI
jgi:hypothetical protein